MPIDDSTINAILTDSSEVEVGTVANPLATKDATTGTLANGAQTAVGAAAVEILAANANRKAAIVQNVGNQPMRVGIAGVTAVTGIQLVAGATLIFDAPYIVIGAIFAIRETADTTAFATEIT
jgi:hypothetical protein